MWGDKLGSKGVLIVLPVMVNDVFVEGHIGVVSCSVVLEAGNQEVKVVQVVED